jgi:hypothetical protein
MIIISNISFLSRNHRLVQVVCAIAGMLGVSITFYFYEELKTRYRELKINNINIHQPHIDY